MSAPSHVEIQSGCERLADQDPILAKAYETVGVPAWRTSPASYATLARAVTFQLISLAAAEAIWQRMLDQFGGALSAKDILQASDAELRACGQSGPKIGHLRSIADAFVTGQIDLNRLERLDSPAAHRDLVSIRGIGPWTANLFLLTALRRIDVFPTGDVGIMEAYRRLAGQEKRHNSKSFAPIIKTWAPVEGVAAHLLWAWLHHDRSVPKSAPSGQRRLLS